MSLRFLTSLALVVGCFGGTVVRGGEPVVVSSTAKNVARTLLNEEVDQQKRRELITQHPDLAAEIVAALAEGIPVGTDEEYVRIPWIWRVGVAATKKLDRVQIRKLLDVGLPQVGEPLHDWQAVVIGGAVINGITLAGEWPLEVLEPMLEADIELDRRWDYALQQSKAMTDNEQVRVPTRYDALRMIGLLSWDESGAQLFRYLQKGVNSELKQGAICGLADLDSPSTAQALLSGWEHYKSSNQFFVFEALLRTEQRASVLKFAIDSGRVNLEFLTSKMKDRLLNHPHALTQKQAKQTLAP